MTRLAALIGVIVLTSLIVLSAQSPPSVPPPSQSATETEQLKLQIRALSETVTRLRYELDVCSGQAAETRYQRNQQVDGEALRALIVEMERVRPGWAVSLAPGGFSFAKKPEPADGKK